jgi:hypothetical protein
MIGHNDWGTLYSSGSAMNPGGFGPDMPVLQSIQLTFSKDGGGILTTLIPASRGRREVVGRLVVEAADID